MGVHDGHAMFSLFVHLYVCVFVFAHVEGDNEVLVQGLSDPREVVRAAAISSLVTFVSRLPGGNSENPTSIRSTRILAYLRRLAYVVSIFSFFFWVEGMR